MSHNLSMSNTIYKLLLYKHIMSYLYISHLSMSNKFSGTNQCSIYGGFTVSPNVEILRTETFETYILKENNKYYELSIFIT